MKTKIECENRALMQFKKRAVAGTIALLLLLPLAAWSGGVVTNCTEANLRAALTGGGTVTFACDGTITLTSTITNVVDTILDGTGREVTISGGNSVRVFYVATNSGLSLIHLTVANGRSTNGAGVFSEGGRVTLINARFVENLATNATPWFQAATKGGGIYNQGGALNATNCLFAGNGARQERSLYSAYYIYPIPSYGGAICNEWGLVNLDQCGFTNNSVQGSGCGTDAATVSGGPGDGGAIYSSGSLVAGACSFLQNSAGGGNGPFGYGGLYGPGYAGGSGGNARGGAVYNAGSLTVDRSLFASNSSVAGAGGLGGSGMGGAFGVFSDLSGGPGGRGGGGDGSVVYNSGSAALTSCTLAFNTGTGGPGGEGGNGGYYILNPHGQAYGFPGGRGGNGGSGYGVVGGPAPAQLTNCSVVLNSGIAGDGSAGGHGGPGASNSAPGSNGTAHGGLRSGTLVNTLLATNEPGGNCFGTLVDLGHNLSSDASCAFTNIGSRNNTDPKLGPLADNGGPTLTIALLPGSPAIDAGSPSPLPTDQRGVARPFGVAADIGAYEFSLPWLRINRDASGEVEIIMSGPNGQTCRLLTSTNLSDWQCVATNQIGPNGTVLFQDNCGTGENQRFYKVALP